MYTKEQALQLSRSAIIAFLQTSEGLPIKKLMMRNASGYSKMNSDSLRTVFSRFCESLEKQEACPVIHLRKLPSKSPMADAESSDDDPSQKRAPLEDESEAEEIQIQKPKPKPKPMPIVRKPVQPIKSKVPIPAKLQK